MSTDCCHRAPRTPHPDMAITSSALLYGQPPHSAHTAAGTRSASPRSHALWLALPRLLKRNLERHQAWIRRARSAIIPASAYCYQQTPDSTSRKPKQTGLVPDQRRGGPYQGPVRFLWLQCRSAQLDLCACHLEPLVVTSSAPGLPQSAMYYAHSTHTVCTSQHHCPSRS